MNTCLVIPVYNHERAIVPLLARLKRFGLPCILVDDGSSPACRQVLIECAARHRSWITLLQRPSNGGKGAAVVDGFQRAIAQGFSHALQIDADGQHDVDDIPKFLELGCQHPEKMILGTPQYQSDAPKSRVHGRKITNFWIAVNTLSTAIGDGMCGFRLYPLAAVGQLLAGSRLAPGMAFDIDIVVRLYWQGLEAVNLATAVRYPLDGVSHFDLWRDNLKISAAHARLFCGMLLRLPRLLARHWR
ncbi:glycosyltransferase family 2 protein [Methylomonas sp. EFPC3]|uniref:glycosyltransferase family 2 protein n=1 Tax=Methylomonas sp. EFPC3 TaxID=3021710 RepID=UPI0024167C29|nr:glycosyltransferase family 2 protein [Methylomonas sp. EFPC3]WFP50258.1 glycosyltransferase family 2 protein [Methylomonas sp. EFPC3]